MNQPVEWTYDEEGDTWFAIIGNFKLAITPNAGPTTRFRPREGCRSFVWSIERMETIPNGEELTLEEAKAAAIDRLKRLR